MFNAFRKTVFTKNTYIFLKFMYLFKVGSIPIVVLELMTLR